MSIAFKTPQPKRSAPFPGPMRPQMVTKQTSLSRPAVVRPKASKMGTADPVSSKFPL